MPKGTLTRPTTDKVREAIFNVLDDIHGTQVLDLYSGTGAMAIEALSRGAAFADLVESRRIACDIIRHNLEWTGMESGAHLWCMPVRRALTRIEGTFDLVTADPPYDDPGVEQLMDNLAGGPLLSERAVVVLEHSSRLDTKPRYGRLNRRQVKRYGDTVVSFYGVRQGES